MIYHTLLSLAVQLGAKKCQNNVWLTCEQQLCDMHPLRAWTHTRMHIHENISTATDMQISGSQGKEVPWKGYLSLGSQQNTETVTQRADKLCQAHQAPWYALASIQEKKNKKKKRGVKVSVTCSRTFSPPAFCLKAIRAHFHSGNSIFVYM